MQIIELPVQLPIGMIQYLSNDQAKLRNYSVNWDLGGW